MLALQAAADSVALALMTLHNAGPAPLVLGTPAITGPGRAAFRLLANGGADSCAANTVLPPDGRCTVRVAATAAAGGLQDWRRRQPALPG